MDGATVSPKTGLEYEIEYILYGNISDSSNAFNAFQDIVLLRIMPNFIYIMTHSPEKEFASSAATLLTSMLPFLQPVVNFLIIFLWATSESTIDVYLLQAGRAVQFYKSPDSFVLTYNAVKFQNYAKKVVGAAAGLAMNKVKDTVGIMLSKWNEEMSEQLASYSGEAKILVKQMVEDARDYALGGADDYAAALDTYIINYLNTRKEYAITKQRLEENIAEAKANGVAPDNMPAYLTDGEFDPKKVAGYTALQAFDEAISKAGGITSDGVIKLIKTSKPPDEVLVTFTDIRIIGLRNDISDELEDTIDIVATYFTAHAQQYITEVEDVLKNELDKFTEESKLTAMNKIEAKIDVLKQKSLAEPRIFTPLRKNRFNLWHICALKIFTVRSFGTP